MIDRYESNLINSFIDTDDGKDINMDFFTDYPIDSKN